MLDSFAILQLYANTLYCDLQKYNVPEEAVKRGIECMAHVYKGETVHLNSERSMIADYSDVAHRCAYLHKYAAFHTCLVKDMLQTAINLNFGFFYRLIFFGDRFRLCSLGGGPGSDVIGVLAALHASFSYFDTSATVVDYMFDWSYSFDSILRELGSGMYGAFGNNTSYFLNWRYVGANLLKTLRPEVLEALGTASLVTMIKFASAAACQDTYSMIRNIFAAMKPGGALLFIDNDGGGFHKLMMDAALEYNFISVFGPVRGENYVNEVMRVKRFGYNSCFKTTVTVHIIQKPFPLSPYGDMPYYSNPCRTLSLYNPRPALLRSPLTPMLYLGDNNENFCQDENANSLKLNSWIEDIAHSPHNVSRVATPFASNIVNTPHPQRSPLYTPDSQLRYGSKRAQGCFPIRLHNFRHHVARKVQKVKSHARAIFQKKKKGKAHPIFKL